MTGFDRHRRGGRCLTPDEIGYRADGSGVYRAPITDAARTSLAALGRRRRDAPSARLSEPQSDRQADLVVADVSGTPDAAQTLSGGPRWSYGIDRDDVQRIRKLGEDLIEVHGWGAMDLDLREILADHGLPSGEHAERELGDHMVWLLS